MDIAGIIQIALIIALGAGMYFQMRKKEDIEDKEELESPEIRLREEVSELKAELKAEQSEKDKLSGQGKALFAENTLLKAEKKSIAEKNDELKEYLAKFRAEQKRREADFQDRISKLDSAKNSLEEEKIRIRREDEERQSQVLIQRDKMWSEHETNVIAQLNDLCKLPEYTFNTFSNTDLPEGFDGKLKPDFMVEFLEQYVIFDAKSSKSDNLQTYISDQVKKTAAKIQSNEKIYSAVYFVVPTEAINTLKKRHFYEQGYSFFVISPEAIAPILASFKKIQTYEFAEQMDPQERENITSLIAEFDQHVNFSNAAHLLLTQRGINSLSKLKGLSDEIQNEVQQKKDKMRLKSFKPSDIKNFMMGTHVQQQAINEHVNPKSDIKLEELKDVNKSLEYEV